MKTVFTSSEIDHIWAHQLAPRGRFAANEHFEGKSFYSYSTEIGRIIERKGKKAYLLNVTGYSITTSGHQSALRRAIPSDALIFSVGDLGRGVSLDRIGGAFLFDYTIKEAAKFAEKSKRARTSKDFYLSRHAGCIEEAKKISQFFGLRRKVDDKAIERMSERITAERKRQAKAENERQARIEKDNADTVKAWINGGDVQFPWLVQKVYLRSRHFTGEDENIMETSKGVTVPLVDAEKAFRFVMLKRESGWRRNGETFPVGEFQLDSVSLAGVVAGCHRIEWSEIERFAKKQGWLK